MKACAINLAERRGGDRLELKLGVNLVDLSSEFLLDPCESDLVRKRRNLIDKSSEFYLQMAAAKDPHAFPSTGRS